MKKGIKNPQGGDRGVLCNRSAEKLVAAARDKASIKGLTHKFYRYPARFSPEFVKSVIELFTDPGDSVFDPFMGGGTTLVEALAGGRHAMGTDISELAAFITQVKTTVLSKKEIASLERWRDRLHEKIRMDEEVKGFEDYIEKGYYRHLNKPDTWRIRKAIEQTLRSASYIRPYTKNCAAFARCTVLRTAQWALDGRRTLPGIAEFRTILHAHITEMLEGAREFHKKVKAHKGNICPKVIALNRSAIGIEGESMLKNFKTPKLVLTSPPYPGVHILYHRWQINGGKETATPFWIADKFDGSGEAYYILGRRGEKELSTYFHNLMQSLSSITSVCNEETWIVQVVAFSRPDWQLEKYLATCKNAGLIEYKLPTLAGKADGRLWRSVPNRKWYADQKGVTHGSQEVVLFHKKT